MDLRKICVASALAVAALGHMAAAEPIARPLDAQLAALAERAQAPGLVAAEYRDGRLRELYTWGGADCAGVGAANANAAYEIGSISKSMTAVAVLQLWDRHRLDVDASLGAYLGNVPEAWKRVTLRQMLTHTSGIPDYEEAGGYGIYETTPTPQRIFDIVRARPLDFEPGAQWSYSNTNYVLLSLIIERVSGMHYGDYMRRHVFGPLHMTHTFVGGYAPRSAVLAQGCKPGETASAARIPVRPIMEASTYGAGGISTTAQDWAHWYDALNRGRLLSPRSMQAMFTAVTLPDGTNTGYGMGMEVDDFRGEPRRGHNGQTQGFVADYASFPNRRLGFLILANAYGAETSVLMRALQVRAMPDLSYDRLPGATDPDPARGELIRRAIRQMILAEEPPFALLSERMRAFPTDPQGADQRARLHDVVADMARFEYLRSEPPPNGGFERYLYRVTRTNGDTSYFMASWSNGQLVGLRWYDE